MKTGTVALAGSLLLNVALVGLLAFRAPVSSPPIPAATSPASNGTTGLQAALAAGDAAALAAAGCPPEVARALAIGRAFDQFQQQIRQARPPGASDDRYWRRARAGQDASLRSVRLLAQKAQRDFSEAVRAAYGTDLESLFSGREGRYSYLPPAKQEQLRRIEQDYEDMMSQVHAEQGGIPLPGDRDKLQLLRTERERDIAAAMTPEEREQFELHESSTARQVMARYGSVLDTEEEYRRIFALQKAFDERFASPDGRRTPEQMRERRAAELALQEQVQAAMKPDQWAVLLRESDGDYRALASIGQRLAVPTGAYDRITTMRASYAAQSQQINANPGVSERDRRSQLQTLAAQAQEQLRADLGTDAARAFAERSEWVRALKNSQAFSTNPRDVPNGTPVNLLDPVHSLPPPRRTPVLRKAD